MKHTAQDNQCITSIDLGVHDAAVIRRGRRTVVVPEMASGHDSSGAISAVGFVASSKECEADVAPQRIFLCPGVEAAMDKIITVQSLSFGTGSEFQSSSRTKLDTRLEGYLLPRYLILMLVHNTKDETERSRGMYVYVYLKAYPKGPLLIGQEIVSHFRPQRIGNHLEGIRLRFTG